MRTLFEQNQGYLRGRQYFRVFNWNRLVARAGGALVVAALALGGVLTVTTAVLAYSGMIALALGFALFVAVRDWSGSASDANDRAGVGVTRFWSYSVRNFVGVIGMQGNRLIDVFALTLVAEPATVGIYAVAVSFAAPIAIVGSSGGLVLMPRVAQAETMSAKAAAFRRTSVYVGIGSGVAAIAAIMLADPLIPLVFGAEFSASIGVARVLSLGLWAVGMSMVTVATLRGLGRPGVAAASQFAGLIVTFVMIVGMSGGDLVKVAYAAVGGFAVSLAIEIAALVVLLRSRNSEAPMKAQSEAVD